MMSEVIAFLLGMGTAVVLEYVYRRFKKGAKSEESKELKQ